MSESENTEFKLKWQDEYLKWICGFANANGGSLFIGMNDDGSVVGLQDYKKLLEDIPNKTRNSMGVTVSVQLLEQRDKKYLQLIVPAYTVPVSIRGHYYKRSGSTNQELTGNSLNEFLMRRFGMSWESITEESCTMNDIDLDSLEHFKQLASDRLPLITDEKNPEIILKKLNLVQNGKLKRAAILLFGKNPQHFYLQAQIKIGRFISESDILSSDIVEGNLFQQIDQTLNMLKSKYLVSPIT